MAASQIFKFEMRTTFLTIYFLLISLNSMAQNKDFITSRALETTFLIQTDISQGTCFTYLLQKEEYLVTAKHLFKSSLNNKDSTRIKLFIDEKLQEFTAQYYISNDPTIDIAVLKINSSISKYQPYSNTEKTALGQELYFLGYPFFSNKQFRTLDKNLGTFPLVKKAVFSGSYPTSNYVVHFLDGQNNPGFSGGPVIAYDYTNGEHGIFGIISGYYNEEKSLRNMGKAEIGKYILENSGIIKCFPITLVKEILNE